MSNLRVNAHFVVRHYLIILLLSGFMPSLISQQASADESTFGLELARKFAPCMIFHSGNPLEPEPVEIYAQGDRLDWRDMSTWFFDQGDLTDHGYINHCDFYDVDQSAWPFCNDPDSPDYVQQQVWGCNWAEYHYGNGGSDFGTQQAPNSWVIPDLIGHPDYDYWQKDWLLITTWNYGGPGNETAAEWKAAYTGFDASGNPYSNPYTRPGSEFPATIYPTVWAEGGNVCIQYNFFYPYNDGWNDHEGDWEGIIVTVDDMDPEQASLVGVRYLFHEYYLDTFASNTQYFVEGTHPVVFVGGHVDYSCGAHGEGHVGGGSFPVPGFWNITTPKWLDIILDLFCNDVYEEIDPGRYLHHNQINLKMIPNVSRIWSGEPGLGADYFAAHPEDAWMRANLRWGNYFSPESPFSNNILMQLFGEEVGNKSGVGPAYSETWHTLNYPDKTNYEDDHNLSPIPWAHDILFYAQMDEEGNVINGEIELNGYTKSTPGYKQLVGSAMQPEYEFSAPNELYTDDKSYVFARWSDGNTESTRSLPIDYEDMIVYTTLNAIYREAGPSPELLSPIDGSTLASPETVVLTWDEFPDAVYYRYQVASAADFNATSIELDTIAVDTSVELPFMHHTLSGTYWWRVCAYANGELTDFSEPWSYTFNYSFSAIQMFPDMNTVDVLPDASMRATFNHIVDFGSISPASFALSGDQSGSIPYTAGSMLYGYQVGAYPNFDFKAGERITLTMTEGIASTNPGETLAHPISVSITASATGDADFHPVTDLPQPEYCSSTDAVLSDLDNDGDLDIASVQMYDKTITIIKNLGMGEYSPYTVYNVGPYGYEDYNPISITAADFDNDGDVDLATGNFGNYSWSYFANNGDGTFANPVVYHKVPWLAGPPEDLHAADVDNDGDMDLVCGTVHNVIVFENLGGGTFDVDFAAYDTFGQARNICVGDLNNDGWIDVAAANRDTDDLCILLNQGDGTYATGVQIGSFDNPGPIACQDIDGDRDLDIIVGQSLYSSAASVVRTYANDGDAGFGTYQSKSISGGQQVGLELLDADGDGWMDVIISKSYQNEVHHELALLINDTTGGLGDPTYLDMINSSSSYYRPNGLDVGDMNGDGTLDLVISNFSPSSTSIFYDLALPAQVVLTSPLHGKITTNTHPNLVWEDQNGHEMSYTVQIDHEHDFRAPIMCEHTGTGSSWTVSPGLSNGTYHWRVKAGNVVGEGDWSAGRSFTINVPRPSCPVLYSYDGEDFRSENPLLTACEQSGYKDVVTDFYLLPEAPAVRDNRIDFQLRELENEITYLNDISLITVDHEADSKVICTIDGGIMAYSETMAPTSAVDQNGADVLELITSRDGAIFQAEGPGTLTLSFPGLYDGGGFSVFAAKKTGCIQIEIPPHEEEGKIAVDPEPGLKVEMKDAEGEWFEIAELPSREWAKLESFQALSEHPGAIEMRLSWTSKFETDIVCQYLPSETEPILTSLSVSDYELKQSNPESVAGDLANDDQPLELRLGDVLAFSFMNETNPSPGMVRSYIIKATGRYQPDYAVYTNLLPSSAKLHGNYPNPFNPTTSIRFDLPVDGHAALSVFDAQGRLIKTLLNEMREAGSHAVTWNGCNEGGNRIASGIYFYNLTAGTYSETRKMIMLK
ncbi:MAG: T9SS type A sorting domain-containing protein [bacterium]|nr:T9SS type A sorting domain-containing protein [bacterium]